MLARFLPQTVPFFKLLMEQNAVLQRMAQSLIIVMENTYESEEHLKQINLLEEEADKLNRKITWHLSQTFITPIDREDIHAINLAQERVADGIQNLASRFFMCGFMYQRFPAHMMTRNIKGMIGNGNFNHNGTSGQNISFQYSFVPRTFTTINVHKARTIVTAILPVKLAS